MKNIYRILIKLVLSVILFFVVIVILAYISQPGASITSAPGSGIFVTALAVGIGAIWKYKPAEDSVKHKQPNKLDKK